MIAALFVDANGIYSGRPDVDAWDVSRDARLYAGPWPIVAHPPCERWGAFARSIWGRGRVAEIIRGWANEEPRALWERLRAERKARGPRQDPEGTAGWIVGGAWAMRRGEPESGYTESRTDTGIGEGHGDGAEAIGARCSRLAEYATIQSMNRLVCMGGPDLMNTGAGGTRYGGDFATPPGEVAERFEGMARGVGTTLFLHHGSFSGKGPEHGIGRPEGGPAGNMESLRPSLDIVHDALDRLASGWPPVLVLPAIPTAADVSAWLGTPGDLEGCVAYCDPNYQGTTGYRHGLTRAEVVAYSLDFASMGAVVCVSEAVPIPELTALGWHATDITLGRRGQKRTFARVATEALTMNREPQHRVATQVSMWSGLATTGGV